MFLGTMTSWTRKRTFDPDLEDWVVLRDGLMVGRVYYDDLRLSTSGAGIWEWSVITMPAHSGLASSLEEALEKVRELATADWGHEPHGWPDDR
ncbi:hypothetical protein [Paracoccus tibetensis]|uniref:Uncharacterized protein n=1 Tax=Paracoccus tibetensis TaxID=336292 RepID=A0A1G5HBA1_9RHOB|nr:hypothetical protein [Paracoccus tibetensis]SCY61155.1 hypothetical protein SAMN05660710_02090 [Paracoccus tibetensis]